MPLEGRELHVAISEKETCPIHRDWHDEETDFKEKSVRYTEIRHTISHMKSRMRESRTSGAVRGVPCERYVYSTPVLVSRRAFGMRIPFLNIVYILFGKRNTQ